MTTSEPHSPHRIGQRGPNDLNNALVAPAEAVLSAPTDASTDELAIAAQYLQAHVQGNQVIKDVLMRTAGPMELTAGLTVLTCLIIDELTGGNQEGVAAVVAHACEASTAYHREDLGIAI